MPASCWLSLIHIYHNIFLGEIDYPALVRHMADSFSYRPIPKFPVVTRDLALIVEESMECGTLTAEIKRACKAVENVELFDIYRGEQVGEGKKSMAFKLTFVPGDKAFSPKDIESFMKKIQSNLKYKLNVDMR